MSIWSEFSAPLRRGVLANLVPGVILQVFALGLVLGYYFVPAFRAPFDTVGAWKQQGGYQFSAISTAIFGGLIPFVILWFSGLVERRAALPTLLFYVGFWLWKGAEVDAFYRAQAALFGSGSSLSVLLPKIFVDQFVYNPLWAAPTQALCFLWKDSGFSFRTLKIKLEEQALTMRIAIILVSTWVVWIPAVAIIYSLPGALQVPLFNLVLCFWSLLLSFVSRGLGNPKNMMESKTYPQAQTERAAPHET